MPIPMLRNINTSESLSAAGPFTGCEDPYPDANESPANQDEDGAVLEPSPGASEDEEEKSQETGAGAEPDQAAKSENEPASEPDLTPALHSLTVTHNGMHTDITARVSTPSGWQNKRIVIPGHMTAGVLAGHLVNVANW